MNKYFVIGVLILITLPITIVNAGMVSDIEEAVGSSISGIQNSTSEIGDGVDKNFHTCSNDEVKIVKKSTGEPECTHKDNILIGVSVFCDYEKEDCIDSQKHSLAVNKTFKSNGEYKVIYDGNNYHFEIEPDIRVDGRCVESTGYNVSRIEIGNDTVIDEPNVLEEHCFERMYEKTLIKAFDESGDVVSKKGYKTKEPNIKVNYPCFRTYGYFDSITVNGNNTYKNVTHDTKKCYDSKDSVTVVGRYGDETINKSLEKPYSIERSENVIDINIDEEYYVVVKSGYDTRINNSIEITVSSKDYIIDVYKGSTKVERVIP